MSHQPSYSWNVERQGDTWYWSATVDNQTVATGWSTVSQEDAEQHAKLAIDQTRLRSDR